MSRRVLNLVVSGALLVLVGASQENKKSDEKEQLCKIFVSQPDSEDESSVKIASEVEKKIKEKKKWFRLAEDPLEADVRIEVVQYGRVQKPKSFSRRHSDVQTEQDAQGGGITSLPAVLDLESGYFIEFLLIVPRQFQLKMMSSGSGPSSAAQVAARRIRTICETYCK